MIKAAIFRAAHEQAKLDRAKFDFLTYRQAFANALRGFQAVAAGYTGSFIIEPR